MIQIPKLDSILISQAPVTEVAVCCLRIVACRFGDDNLLAINAGENIQKPRT